MVGWTWQHSAVIAVIIGCFAYPQLLLWIVASVAGYLAWSALLDGADNQ